MNGAGEVARPFVPWSLPLAGGVATGVAAAALRPAPSPALWGGTALALLVAVLAAVRVAVPAGGNAPGRGVAVLFVVGMLAGAGRMGLWLARPDRVAGLLGAEATYCGRSDGSLLLLERPQGVRLTLSPPGSVPAGSVCVEGVSERPQGRRNPGGFDYRGYLERRGVGGVLRVRKVVSARPAVRLLERFRRGVARGLAPSQAAVMEAMTLGLRDRLGDLRDRFAAAGLAHVLALSGLHVGVLVAALGRALAGLGRRRLPLLAVATVLYVALVGPSPSVTRAALMVLAGLAGLASGHGRIRAWPSLALAATASLLLAPAQLLDSSFQLSYLAVGGMLLFAGPLARAMLARLPAAIRARSAVRWLVPAVAASVSAQLPSLSLVAGSFGRIPLLSPLVNLVAIPLAGVLVPLGFVAALVGLVSPWAAAAVNVVVGLLASLLLTAASWGSRLPHLTWGEVAPLGHACFALAMLACALAVHGRLRPWRALLVVACASTVSAAVPPAHGPPEAVFLDVGQGDATLLRAPGGVEVLVDGGGTPFGDRDVGAEVVLPALRALGVRTLDAVVATHPDLDHVEGLASVLERLPVGALVMGPPFPAAPIDRRLRAVAAARGIPVHRAARGERLRLGRSGGLELDVLAPGARAAATANENSVALVVRYAGVPQLLMLGDAPAAVERTLAVPRVPVLKVAHHGSRLSTGETLLRAAGPRLAIVSVGENRYGHPDAGVLARLAEHGVRVVTTLDGGALRLPLSARGPGPLVATRAEVLVP